MNRQEVGSLVIMLIIIAVLIIGGIWYYEAHESGYYQPAPTQVSTSTAATPANSTLGWATYSNSQYDFSFRYPQNLTLSNDGPYTSQAGTQPDSLDDISVGSSSSDLFDVEIFGPGIVQGNYGWPERPCGEWTFGPDDGPVSSKQISFAGQKTLDVVSRGFGESTSSFPMNEYYCVDYPKNPIVIVFGQEQATEIQPILSTFQFFTRSGESGLP